MKRDLMNDEVDKALRFDALAEAEQATGKSYKEDGFTQALGLAAHIRHVQDKRALMQITGDSDFSCSVERYLQIVGDIGFKVVHKEDFRYTRWEDAGTDDSLYIMWWDAGVLLVFDTYYGHKTVNSGKFYYNWKPNAEFVRLSHSEHEHEHAQTYYTTSSGSWCDDRTSGEFDLGKAIWAGDHDCREAIRHNITKLLRFGSFVTPWQYRVGHNACGPYSQDVTVQCFAKLPKEVQEAIAVSIKGM